ncbi:MAG: T9SS type A sorting domain-containing protein [Nonlabens sp.]|uniref:T9SS type A sorting domain-containing protein n=1 Tax=Nonlabens sp. TaxID=1888209 RepID=UPI003EF1334A
MKHLYLLLIASLFSYTAQAQFIEFDFDNATVSGNTVTQDVFLNGIGYRLTAVHGSTSPGTLFDNGTGDLFLQATGGGRPEQNWTFSLIKAGSSENFDFISVDYLNNGTSSVHTFVIADDNNNLIMGQTNIPPGNGGTFIPDSGTAANALNVSSCLVAGLTFFSTMETYLNNLRIRPVSLLSNEDVALEQVNYYQNSVKNLFLSHSQLESAQIEIMNMNGQLIQTLIADSNDYEVNVSELSSGMYLAQVIIDDQVQTIKFIK